MPSIQKVADRERLKPRNAPYFDSLGRGRALGFRKTVASSSGTWIARWRDPETGKQHTQTFGALDTYAPTDRYNKAKEQAEAWFQHLGHGGSVEVVTVRTACERYADSLHDEQREKAAAEVMSRFERYIFNQPIAAIELGKLAPRHIEDWRRWLAKLPTARGGKRSAAGLNRDLVCLRSALNHAFAKRLVSTDVAWRTELKPIAGAGQRRELYLSREQRQALINAAAPDFAAFLRALCCLPFRPGAMAALRVGDFDKRLSTVSVRTDKAGKGRSVTLPPEVCQIFSEAAKNKLPSAPLFARADGLPWVKDKWSAPMQAAAKDAALPAGATLYTLRHSLITDLVQDGTDLATVAKISGTSVLMIQKHYHHLQQAAATKALARVAM